MKKSFLLILIGVCSLAISSCVKKQTCKCTTTLSVPGYYPHETVTIQDIKKSTKKKAKQICDNTARQLQTNTDQLWEDDVSVSAKCEIKDY